MEVSTWHSYICLHSLRQHPIYRLGRLTQLRGWEKVTKDDLARLQARRGGVVVPTDPKPSKHRNIRIFIDGEWFDSKKEAAYWIELQMRQKAGDIIDLQRQITFYCYAPMMDDAGVPIPGRMTTVSEYIADFVYRDAKDKRRHVVDVKGAKKRICPYPLKKKWLELQEGIIIEEL